MGNDATGPISFRQWYVSDLLIEPDLTNSYLRMKPRPCGGVFFWPLLAVSGRAIRRAALACADGPPTSLGGLLDAPRQTPLLMTLS